MRPVGQILEAIAALEEEAVDILSVDDIDASEAIGMAERLHAAADALRWVIEHATEHESSVLFEDLLPSDPLPSAIDSSRN